MSCDIPWSCSTWRSHALMFSPVLSQNGKTSNARISDSSSSCAFGNRYVGSSTVVDDTAP
eukprot:4260718-Prymnesium_polylepis.1